MIWDLYLKELMLMFSYKFSLILFWSKSKWIWFTPSALKSQIYHLSLFSKFLFWAGFRFQHFFDSIFFDVELLYLRISIFWAIFDFWLSTSIFYVRLPAFSVQSFPSPSGSFFSQLVFLIFGLLPPALFARVLQLRDMGCLGRHSECSNILNPI